jgi:hypothetical protein
MFKKYKIQIIILFILSVVVLPVIAFAAPPLVPCGSEGNPCTLCHFYILTENIIGFMMWYLAPALAIFIVAWGGFNILIAGSDPARKQAGRKAITAAIVGLLIVFGAWVIINQFLLSFSGQKSGTAKIFSNPWTKVECN